LADHAESIWLYQAVMAGVRDNISKEDASDVLKAGDNSQIVRVVSDSQWSSFDLD
jgi:hypothetical protein